jgi:hypothetical protein
MEPKFDHRDLSGIPSPSRFMKPYLTSSLDESLAKMIFALFCSHILFRIFCSHLLFALFMHIMIVLTPLSQTSLHQKWKPSRLSSVQSSPVSHQTASLCSVKKDLFMVLSTHQVCTPHLIPQESHTVSTIVSMLLTHPLYIPQEGVWHLTRWGEVSTRVHLLSITRHEGVWPLGHSILQRDLGRPIGSTLLTSIFEMPILRIDSWDTFCGWV